MLFAQATAGEESATACALRNEIILRNVFTHLPLSDLKRCGLTSKNWNFQVGSYIRDFRRCSATVGGTRPCYDLQVLNHLVRRMNIVQINGLTINFGWSFHSDCVSNSNGGDSDDGNEPDTHVFCGDLIERLPLKHLRVAWRDMPEECPVLMFVIAVFREKFQDLHSLQIDYFPDMFCSYFGNFGDYWTAPALPKLKQLHIVDMEIIENTSVRNFALKVLNVAPNLEKLSGEIKTTKLDLLPEKKYSLLTNIHLRITSADEDEMRAYLDLCTKLAQARPKLSTLVTSAPESWEIEFLPVYFRILEQLLISSAETLKELTILPAIFPLCYFPVVLVNLKKLVISTGSPPQQVLTLLRSINYSKSLPALECVELTADGDLDSDDELFVNPWERREFEAAELKPLTLKTLDLRFIDWTQFTFENLSSVFTNVSDRLLIIRFSFGARYTIPVPYQDLWGHWPEVKAVELVEELRGNYDAEFLGIYPEEAHILREMDDKSLEQLNIVPIRPSVLTRSG